MENKIVKKIAKNDLVEAKKMVQSILRKKLGEAINNKRKEVYKTIFRQK